MSVGGYFVIYSLFEANAFAKFETREMFVESSCNIFFTAMREMKHDCHESHVAYTRYKVGSAI